MRIPRRFVAALSGATLATLALAGIVLAATIVVTPTNQQGWQEDNLADGDVEFVADETTPGGQGALELRTPSAAAKANYAHLTNTELSEVTELSYFTRQVFAPPGAQAIAAVSYQLGMCLNGTVGGVCAGFTTLVFEPYQNPQQSVVVPETWQFWDVDEGLFWSTRTVICSDGAVAGTPGGPANYTLEVIEGLCPDAVVFEFAANAGTNNPGWVVRTDLFNFNGTTYDFELTNEPGDADDCKDGGWQELTDDEGEPFSNQGLCIKHAKGAGDGGGTDGIE